MIEFEVLVMKAETNNLYAIFLLKKNVQMDIIKMILGYPPIVASEMLREQKVVITSVGQGYESMASKQDYRTETRMIFRGRGAPINIRKAKDNFDKDGKPKCFNCNIQTYDKEMPKAKKKVRYQKIL